MKNFIALICFTFSLFWMAGALSRGLIFFLIFLGLAISFLVVIETKQWWILGLTALIGIIFPIAGFYMLTSSPLTLSAWVMFYMIRSIEPTL